MTEFMQTSNMVKMMMRDKEPIDIRSIYAL